MEAIVSALKEEREQAKRLVQRYAKELEGLPRGTFFLRWIGKKQYGYLTFSEKGKIRQQYVGNDEADIKKYQEQMNRRKKLIELKKKAEKQLSFLEKALRHAGKKS